jgi:hypothetical protein
MSLSPNRFIDPYDVELPKPQRREGPVFEGWKGPTLKIRGGNLQFYSAGTGFWVVVGRGPDGVLNLSQPILDSIATHWKRENGTCSFDAGLLSPYTYDPSNGTMSAGDIWRIPELE